MGAVKPFVFVEPIQHFGIVGQLKNLSCDPRTVPGEDRSRILAEIEKLSMHKSFSNSPETPHCGRDFGRRVPW